jgi:L-fuconolactonase
MWKFRAEARSDVRVCLLETSLGVSVPLVVVALSSISSRPKPPEPDWTCLPLSLPSAPRCIRLRHPPKTDFVVAAEPHGFVAGIVGFADLRIPEIDDVLGAHIEAAAGRFRGIRHRSAWDPSIDVLDGPPAGLLSDPAFRSGFAALARRGLSFDAWLYHPQIPEVTDLARAHPDVLIVLDHLGAPLGVGPYGGRRDEVLKIWRLSMQQLATCPNVVIKLGGIGMPIFGMKWHEQPGGATSEEIAAEWGGELLWCIEQFGVDRCMFESNFPVDKVSFSYPVLWNAFKRMAINASPSEKAALFHDTATRVYRL